MRSSRTGLVLTVAAAAVFFLDCSTDSALSGETHFGEEIPPVASGECDGAPILERDRLVRREPKAGTVIALEGVPQPRPVCTLKYCDTECCNECGYQVGCAYVLNSDEGSVCLSHEEFNCGGMDCSLKCSPFSAAPQHGYRFVGKVVYESVHTAPTLEVHKVCRID